MFAPIREADELSGFRLESTAGGNARGPHPANRAREPGGWAMESLLGVRRAHFAHRFKGHMANGSECAYDSNWLTNTPDGRWRAAS